MLPCFLSVDPDEAERFCTEGIDPASSRGYQRFPHTDLGKPVTGLLVTPNRQAAPGPVVLKFKTEAQHLHHPYPSQEAEANELYQERFPQSFRPSLSQALTGDDPRALFLGKVPPQAIERV